MFVNFFNANLIVDISIRAREMEFPNLQRPQRSL